MQRRKFLVALGSVLALRPRVLFAQKTDKPIVGFLGVGSPETFSQRISAFRKGLAEAGFVENKNVWIEYRWANDVPERLPSLAAGLIERKVNVIATGGGPAPALVAKSATSDIPIVFATPGSDPIELGLVTSMNRPTANVTGVGFLVSSVSAKQAEVISEAIPNASSIGLLINRSNPNSSYYIKNVQEAAEKLGRKIVVFSAATEPELDQALSTIVEQHLGAFIAVPDVFFFRQRHKLVAWAAANSIAGIYGSRDFPEAGGLMSYGTSIDDGYRLEGVYVGRILKGERPSDLPVQQAEKIELVINLKAAKGLGLSIPITLLGRADEVIE
ncbi:ABC transporter substrate-binding protein [Bradyrhizobium guangzhouense]|uniref:ABC transporter substrate-binding protein n=1 Tax=Bradyrhizobium guangzhouense TaxID=1325095 RepID=UPI001009FE80|nr:ABC transporter substrate-binding protein [Bradyrhizobium guangzhouense]RXH12447.1 ABC transporter substrate-binding protein [Bradyrhizobium guangzhouense]